MPNTSEAWPSLSEQIVVLAPTGQDATLIAGALAGEKVPPRIVGNLDGAIQLLHQGEAAVLIIAEESLEPSCIARLNQALEDQEPWSDVPLVLMTSSGDTTLATMRITRALSPAGNLTLLERPFRKITLQSVVQVALRARRKQHQVRELLERQVAATRMRDEFISIASHELKTPLTSLKLQTQLNQRKIARGDAQAFEPATTRKLVDSTSRQVDRLVHLVEDMLDVSRISLKKLHLRLEEFDLSELVSETCDRMQPQASGVGSAITLPKLAGVRGRWDRFRIEQIVSNLLSNAIRYCPGSSIEVSVWREADCALVAVRDHGPGIAPENLERIFERFERGVVGNSVSGMGVGLFISREIAAAHGGTLLVESSLGCGSEFILKLPLSPL